MDHTTLDLKNLDILYCEKTQFGDYTINIKRDDEAQSPRDDETIGTIVTWHGYDLSDNNHGYESPDVFMHVMSGLYPLEYTDHLSDKQLIRCKEIAQEKNIILPVFAYEHGGITISTGSFSCQWDSGQVGYIYISLEDVRKQYGYKLVTQKRRELMEEYLESEIKVFDQFLTNDVYGFTVLKGEGEVIDSCWGFYGYNEQYMIDEIKSSIEFDINDTPQQAEMVF